MPGVQPQKVFFSLIFDLIRIFTYSFQIVTIFKLIYETNNIFLNSLKTLFLKNKFKTRFCPRITLIRPQGPNCWQPHKWSHKFIRIGMWFFSMRPRGCIKFLLIVWGICGSIKLSGFTKLHFTYTHTYRYMDAISMGCFTEVLGNLNYNPPPPFLFYP